jgi:hypothetical protein
MSNFHVGQKVVCIKDGWVTHAHVASPRKGEIYTVRDKLFDGECPSLRFFEIVNSPVSYINMPAPVEPAFCADCFRPVVERKTSIEMFRKLLVPHRELAPIDQ